MGRPVGTGGPTGGVQTTPGTRGGGGKLLLIAAVVVIFLLTGGKGLLGGLIGGSDGDGSSTYGGTETTGGQTAGQATGQLVSSLGSLGDPSAFLSSYMGGYGSTPATAGWYEGVNNTGSLNRSVSSGARDKFTTIWGDGSDQVTIMVYMCGADLESKSGMATNDLREMASASLSDHVNLLVYTGGCKSWKTQGISNSVNQIYRVRSQRMECLSDNAGSGAMTDPDTLVGFLDFCRQNYPANRNMLIFWDHGGGSVSGYGYDERVSGSGTMNLAGINAALKKAGMKFDFIGFDTCLMATVETALVASSYADYLVASEETEPGIGWYYTDWLTALSANPGQPTLEIGQNIVDDFVDTCASKCSGQKATLSVIDLAELGETLSGDFKAFSGSISDMIKADQYQTISAARSDVREFATSSKIDQIDLVHFARSLETKEGDALAETLLSAVKYNRTSSNMTNAYGISAYFPYRRTSYVDKAVKTYDQIGLDDEYSDCIREFASVEVSGQAVTGGSANPLELLMGSSSASSGASYGGVQSLDMVSSLLGSLLGGRSNISGLEEGNTAFLQDRAYSQEDIAKYITGHQFDASTLSWQQDSEGNVFLQLTEEQMKQIRGIALSAYYDDGTGFIDLGVDNLLYVDEQGRLWSEADGTWISINGQPVAYYYTDTIYTSGTDYMSTGYIPALLNGEYVKLIVIFDREHPYGYVAGAAPDYRQGETDAVARGLIEIQKGDRIDFLCDFYRYDGTFEDSYYIGDPITVDGELEISNTYVDAEKMTSLYRITDLYNQYHWTPEVPVN